MWKLDPSDRITHWRDFRKSLNHLSLDQAVITVAEFWQPCPFSPYYLDPDAPDTWPDPWTLIYENHYCDIAKCLGIMYTILLTEHRKNIDVELRVYQDSTTGYVYNLSWINQGKYIINLIDGTVVNNTQFDKTLKLQNTLSAAELKLENY
jgi:hypothetical protein